MNGDWVVAFVKLLPPKVFSVPVGPSIKIADLIGYDIVWVKRK